MCGSQESRANGSTEGSSENPLDVGQADRGGVVSLNWVCGLQVQ